MSDSIPQLDHLYNRVTSNREKADLFNRLFTGHGDPYARVVYPILPENNPPNLENIDVSPRIVEEVLAAINANKSDGPDNIQNMVLKKCAQSLCVPLSVIFRRSLDTGEIPSDWKFAIVTPIYKNKGSKSDPTKYRPISITSAVGKVLEKIINSVLRRHLLENNLINQSQFGFLPGHSSTDQISFIMHKFLDAFENKKVPNSKYLSRFICCL